jgi:hypothetical protein
MSDNTVEALLRPPVEINVAYAAFFLSLIIFLCPTIFMLTEKVSYGVALSFVAFGVIRYKQGYVIKNYHKNLKRLPDFKMNSNAVPVHKKSIWIGKGFEWNAIHTQRLSALLKRSKYRQQCHQQSNQLSWAID